MDDYTDTTDITEEEIDRLIAEVTEECGADDPDNFDVLPEINDAIVVSKTERGDEVVAMAKEHVSDSKEKQTLLKPQQSGTPGSGERKVKVEEIKPATVKQPESPGSEGKTAKEGETKPAKAKNVGSPPASGKEQGGKTSASREAEDKKSAERPVPVEEAGKRKTASEPPGVSKKASGEKVVPGKTKPVQPSVKTNKIDAEKDTKKGTKAKIVQAVAEVNVKELAVCSNDKMQDLKAENSGETNVSSKSVSTVKGVVKSDAKNTGLTEKKNTVAAAAAVTNKEQGNLHGTAIACKTEQSMDASVPVVQKPVPENVVLELSSASAPKKILEYEDADLVIPVKHKMVKSHGKKSEVPAKSPQDDSAKASEKKKGNWSWGSIGSWGSSVLNQVGDSLFQVLETVESSFVEPLEVVPTSDDELVKQSGEKAVAAAADIVKIQPKTSCEAAEEDALASSVEQVSLAVEKSGVAATAAAAAAAVEDDSDNTKKKKVPTATLR